ncbi:MAG: type II secretion system F family protein [Ectothiorhodospiraceae bacterium AqS1]|nr:type II secretion system F family protein [Ectothiorhodospiraceae bacterium AqS1]
MPEYEYQAVDRSGQIFRGRLESESEAAAVRALGAEGRTVIELNERQSAAAAGQGLLKRRLNGQEIVVAFNELATLLESGVALADAVRALSRGARHPILDAGFASISRELLRGGSLLDALRGSAIPLPEYVFQLVEAGELSGQLPQSLRQAVGQMEYDQQIATEIRGALIYPAILIFAGVAAVLLVFVFVVPQFSNLLEDNENLPLLAEIVLRSGVWFDSNRWELAGALIAIAAILTLLSRQAAVRQWAIDTLSVFPVLGEWFSESDTARWAAVMSAMLSTRVELMDALGLASQGVRTSRRKARLDQVTSDVRGGASLSQALEKRDALTATGYNLLRAGEQAGKMPQMLLALATLYRQNSSRRMKRTLSLIEPLAVVIIGVVLGTVMIGVVLAITSINEIPI